nr:PREDICTED: U-box domain-containing protein 35-like isoform X1 [Musa acuminata subsp. malaccensis]
MMENGRFQAMQRVMSQKEQSDGQARQLVAVAVDRDKSSHAAFRWALDNVVTKGQTLTLIHVNTKSGYGDDARDVFVPFRCFCTRKDVYNKDVILEDTDVAKAIIGFVADAAIEKLVVGSSSSRGGFVRSFRNSDISTNIYKGVPDFCTVYLIHKGKVSSVKNAVRPAPAFSLLQKQIQGLSSVRPDSLDHSHKNDMKDRNFLMPSEAAFAPRNLQREDESIKSPFTRGTCVSTKKSNGEMMIDGDKSLANARSYPPRLSNISDTYDCNSESSCSSGNEVASLSSESLSSQPKEDVEAKLNRLRLELKQTMDMYSTARREALTAKQKTMPLLQAMELQRWKMEDEPRLEEAQLVKEAANVFAQRETAEASRKIAVSKSQKNIRGEVIAETEKNDFEALSHTSLSYRKYTIEEIEVATDHYAQDRKIGEGGYGPVYRGYLDHTPVAIKVLRPDAAQGRTQFQREVEILCCIRHPNMVLLLGACPEHGCLVYEYMANGSLEDCLFRRGNTPPIPWQHRFRIAAEIGTGLLFLHQTKPEPLVHRDLKPANILLDRNYVSKISDVGLARLVPPTAADHTTQYCMTATAGTFCYIDPEYQQTGMLGVKSDIYSLGIILLQIITSKSPMGLAHYMERAIERGTFTEMLDQSVPDWPVEEALRLAKLALKCAELRRKDRPDLAMVILPELDRLRDLAEENMQYFVFGSNPHPSLMHTPVSTQDIINGSSTTPSGYESSSGSSMAGSRLSIF